jgi:hypothetical protein
MLPIVSLAPCATCGQSNQGTRARGGNSVPCSNCGTMRRVPMDRRLIGPDDPRAQPPAARGRPFADGNPYRLRPGEMPARAAVAARPAAPASAPTRPKRPAPAPTAGPQRGGAAGRARDPRFATMPELPGYVACEECAEYGIRTGEGIYAASVAMVGLWVNDVAKGQSNVCAWHLETLSKKVESMVNVRLHIIRRA